MYIRYSRKWWNTILLLILNSNFTLPIWALRNKVSQIPLHSRLSSECRRTLRVLISRTKIKAVMILIINMSVLIAGIIVFTLFSLKYTVSSFLFFNKVVLFYQNSLLFISVEWVDIEKFRTLNRCFLLNLHSWWTLRSKSF